MTTMVTELYDALREAGASDEKARKAAEALANYDDRFNRLERQIDDLDHTIDQSSGRLEIKLDQGLSAIDRKIDQGLSAVDRKIDGLDNKIDRVKSDLQLDIADVRADGRMTKWMLGAVFALLIPVFLKQFLH